MVWRWARDQWKLLVALVIAGPGMVLLGWLFADTGYLSDVLLQFGSTFSLLIPLLFLERQLSGRLDTLTEEVGRLRISFSETISSDIEADANASLAKFQALLSDVGLALPETPPTLIVRHGEDRLRANFENGNLWIGASLLNSHDVIPHLYAHEVLRFNHAKGADSEAIEGIEAGISDFLTAVFLEDPQVNRSAAELNGNPEWLRDLSRHRNFDTAHWSWTHDVGEIWGSIFWEASAQYGRKAVGRLVVRAWRLASSDDDFVRRLTSPESNATSRALKEGLARRGYRGGYQLDPT